MTQKTPSEEGREAHIKGASLWSNPYKLGSADWCAWEEGWLDSAIPNRDNRMGLLDYDERF